eukprot:3234490-Pleurochrysis_carterae.AAC.6
MVGASCLKLHERNCLPAYMLAVAAAHRKACLLESHAMLREHRLPRFAAPTSGRRQQFFS